MKDAHLNARTKKKPRRSAPKGFDYGSIPIEDKKVLLEIVAALNSIARKNTEEIFDLGRRFAEAKERLPRRFDEWLKKECKGISTKSAFNYMTVHARFAVRHDEIIGLGLKPTHLYALANAPGPAVEEVFDRVAGGEKVIGTDIAGIIKIHSDPSDFMEKPKTDHPLRKGLMAKLKPITEAALDVWLDRLTDLRKALLGALPDESLSKFVKGPLVETVMYDARWLERELERLTGFGFNNNAYPGGRPQPERPSWSDDGHWYQVSRALFSLGGLNQIAAVSLEACIRSEFLPALDWALGYGTADDYIGAVVEISDSFDDSDGLSCESDNGQRGSESGEHGGLPSSINSPLGQVSTDPDAENEGYKVSVTAVNANEPSVAVAEDTEIDDGPETDVPVVRPMNPPSQPTLDMPKQRSSVTNAPTLEVDYEQVAADIDDAVRRAVGKASNAPDLNDLAGAKSTMAHETS